MIFAYEILTCFQMDASGVVHEEEDPRKKKKNGKMKNGKLPGHRKKNNSPYGTFAKKNGAASPTQFGEDTCSAVG